jgi:protocatechuate 3,4-dioxygenase beta subunit
VQLPEGQTMLDRNPEGNWREVSASDGAFRVTGLPPGRITVQVRADGWVDAASKDVDLTAGQSSDVLEFTLRIGLAASGTVVDAATGKPVGDAQVTAYQQKPDNKRRGPFDFQFDREDFDFMALASTQNQHSTVTDSHGSFRLEALEPGKYRFTARHPDLAKASAKDVEIVADKPATGIEIKLDAGGGVEGAVTGVGQRPLADALIVALSLQAGSFKSATTDKAGFYRIDGLPPGQYVVFKSRLDERADNIPLELMSNMRLKTVTVRQGKFTRLDVQDDSDDGVRVFGVVREAGAPVPRALVTVLGADKDGFLGMGVRANSSRDDGRYELLGIKPGSYLFQISRFRGRPLQTTLSVDVPEGQRDFQLDLDLPTSEVSGRVVDTRGQPVAGMQVALGSDQGALGASDGLLGLLAQGGFGQARTDDQGQFKIASVAAGTYRLTAGSRLGPGRRGGGNDGKYGEASLPGIVVDGAAPVAGLLVTVPLAGRIHGIVVDGSNQPVAGAEIHFDSRDRSARPGKRNPMLDMLGAQARPIASGNDGQFDITGLTPGVYDLRADAEGLDAGKAADVQVAEDQTSEVTIRIVRGAQLRLRATNVDRSQIPLANLSLLDGQGHPVVNKVSSLTVMRRLMGNRDKVEDSGWYEFGNVPPDTYTVVIAQPGEEDIRITRTVIDGEHVEWDIDVAAELASRRTKKQ